MEWVSVGLLAAQLFSEVGDRVAEYVPRMWEWQWCSLVCERWTQQCIVSAHQLGDVADDEVVYCLNPLVSALDFKARFPQTCYSQLVPQHNSLTIMSFNELAE